MILRPVTPKIILALRHPHVMQILSDVGGMEEEVLTRLTRVLSQSQPTKVVNG